MQLSDDMKVLLTSVVGVENDEIFAGSRRVEIDGIPVSIISLEDLVRVKRGSKRPCDLADADELVKINRSR
ncbi:MAG: hypothetical protein MUC56_15550 [Thermoanaerobaculales bacterium]|nr:hypothetical protein [Thermoanaerobaculales bacterium]